MDRDERKLWNDKLIKKLLLIITMVVLKRFTLKTKPVIYTGTFVELYNKKNRRQVYEIYGIIELEKIRILIAKSLHNLDAYQIIEITSVLRSTYMVPRN